MDAEKMMSKQEQFVADKLRELFTMDELLLMGNLLANEADVMDSAAAYRATLVSVMRKLRLVVPVYAPGRGTPTAVSEWLDKQPTQDAAQD